MTKLLIVLLLGVPLFEIALLIHVGTRVGALPTVALVILTAVIGVLLLRQQGRQTITRARSKLERGDVPTTEALEALILLMSGGLLLAPGFCTDCLGFLLLIPGIRMHIVSNIPTPQRQDRTAYTIDHPSTRLSSVWAGTAPNLSFFYNPQEDTNIYHGRGG